MHRPLLLLLFFLSGATALAYEVAWTRHLVLVFGNTTTAMALILAAYMAGLALGSEAGGRLADRVRKPAVLYAVAELLIGGYALVFPWLVRVVRDVYLSLDVGGPVLLLGGAFVALLVPTFLMGATLPFLVRARIRSADETGSVVGGLYAANLFGAVVGTAATGFLLIEHFGVLGSSYIAAAVNVAIGIVGFVLLSRGPVAVREEAVDARGDVVVAQPERSSAAAALVGAFTGGLVGLAAQVVWTRLLVFFLQGFTYTFSAMLATFLLGLGLGGLVFGRVAARSRRPDVTLGRLQVTIGLACAGVLLLLSRHQRLTEHMWELAGTLAEGELRLHHVLTLVLSSGAALIVPAFLMGGVLPLAAAAYERGLGDVGTRVGHLYAVNTLGAVGGALLAGFVLAPTVGMAWGAVAVTAIALVGATLVVVLARRQGGGGGFVWPVLATGVAVVLVALARPARPFLLRSHVFEGSNARENVLVETREGTVAQVSVVRNEREGYELLYTDEFQAAGTKPEYRYMRMLAHLPVALVDDPERVLCICWGTGTTSGSISTHPDVHELDIVEISPEVLEVAHYFEQYNRGVLDGAGRDDLDVRVHVGDGRHFVLRAEEQWNVITLEPLMPYTPAAIHFYTEDFYRECVPRLAPGGLMCQWIPLQGMSRVHFEQLVAAFVRVFPESGIFFVDGAVALIGRPADQGAFTPLPFARAAGRLRVESVQDDLAPVGFAEPEDALATLVAGPEELAAFVEGVEPVTDEHPVLEFHPIPLRVGLKHLYENLGAMKELGAQVGLGHYDLDDVERSGRVADHLARSLQVERLVREGQLALEEAGLLARADHREAAGTSFAASRDAFRKAYAMDPGHETARRYHEGVEREAELIKARTAADQGEFDLAVVHARRSLRYAALRQDDVAWTVLAEALNRAERFREAVVAASEAIRRFPRGPDALCERALARGALGDLVGAASDYRRALGPDGRPADLEPRFRSDAERVLATAPEIEEGADGAAIERAFGESSADPLAEGDVRLRVLRADLRDDFDAHFASDLQALTSSQREVAARLVSLGRVWRAAPTGAGAALVEVLGEEPLDPDLAGPAARALADVDPGRFTELARRTAPQPLVLAWIRGAAHVEPVLVVEPLLERLLHPSEPVRAAAQQSLFALLGDAPPWLARLDTASEPDADYRRRVADIRAWWAREGS